MAEPDVIDGRAPQTNRPDDDARLLADAAAVMRDMRRRAPGDFLSLLTILLGGAVVGLLGAGLLVGPSTLADLFLNLAAEVFGAWLTVVLIDGLWRRFERGSEREFEAGAVVLDGRRMRPLTEQERRAWRLLVDVYRDAEPDFSARNPFRVLAAMVRTMWRMRILDREGNRTFDDFTREVRGLRS
jgi:hypothetical protein